MMYAILYLCNLIKVLSTARTYGLVRSSKTNRFPIAAILSLISIEMIFNRLSKVRLSGRCDTDKPQAFIILLLYGKSKHRKWCSDLFESSLNQTRTIKHRRIMAWVYTKGLPLWRCFFTELHDQSIIPIRYKMLIRMDDELYVASLFGSIFVSLTHYTPLD